MTNATAILLAGLMISASIFASNYLSTLMWLEEGECPEEIARSA